VLVDGYTYGLLSMTACPPGAGCPADGDDVTAAAAELPEPSVVPPEATNT